MILDAIEIGATLWWTGSRATAAEFPFSPPRATIARNVLLVKRQYHQVLKLAKKGTTVDSGHLYYIHLALLAEQAGNYEDAAKQWRRASSASLQRDRITLYEDRCEEVRKKIKGGI